MKDDSIEQQLQDKGLTAPRVTPTDIQNLIAAEYTGRASILFTDCPGAEHLSTLTICVLLLKNGFTVTGESACASPENFDMEIGARLAREDARRKIWPLAGYALKEKLVRGEPA